MRAFLFLLSFVFSASSFSEDYYFTVGPGTTHYPDALSACIAGYPGNFSYFIMALRASGGFCNYSYTDARGNTQSSGPDYSRPINRYGDGCANGTVDPSTFACVPSNSCAAKKDQATGPLRWTSNSDMPPKTTSNGGCSVSLSGARCWYESAGKAVCTGSGSYSGDQLAPLPSGSMSSCDGATCTADLPQPQKQNQDCVYATDASGKSSCTAVNSQSNPGNAQCGTVNGAWTCIENPKATSNTDTLNSVKTSTSNADGTLTVVKDNTVTTISCSGKVCTTSVTTSQGTTTTTSGGAVVGNGSSCTGSKCNGSGEASTGTGSGSNTDQPPQQGGITTTTLHEPDKGNFEAAGDEWDGKINDAKKDFSDGLDKLKGAFSPLKDINLSAGGKLYCPPPAIVLGKSISFCIDQYSGNLSWISTAILLICACIALMIVFT